MNRAVLHNLESLVEGRRKREGGGKKKEKKKKMLEPATRSNTRFRDHDYSDTITGVLVSIPRNRFELT